MGAHYVNFCTSICLVFIRSLKTQFFKSRSNDVSGYVSERVLWRYNSGNTVAAVAVFNPPRIPPQK